MHPPPPPPPLAFAPRVPSSSFPRYSVGATSVSDLRHGPTCAPRRSRTRRRTPLVTLSSADTAPADAPAVRQTVDLARLGAAWLDAVLSGEPPTTTGGDGDEGLRRWQERARGKLAGDVVPGRKDEDWRFTNLRPLYEATVGGGAGADGVDAGGDLVAAAGRGVEVSEVAARVVLVNGVVAQVERRAEAAAVEGLVIAAWKDVDAELRARVLQFLDDARETSVDRGDVFQRLNAAALGDVCVVRLPRNAQLTKPIFVLNVASGGGGQLAASHPRVVVVADDNSSASIVEAHVCETEETSAFVNSCASFSLQPGASVEHSFVSTLTNSSFHINSSYASVSKDSHYGLTSVATGARVARSTAGIDLVGRGGDGRLYGLGVAGGQNTADLHSRIAHNVPNCTSEQLHKNVAAARGHAVFRGRIIVEHGAVQTDSSQLCRSMLLSSKAEVDAMPNLEIHCDDVKCSHGATVASLTEDELFYIQSRGLPEEVARYLLINGFVEDLLRNVPLPSVCDRVRDAVREIAESVRSGPIRPGTYSSI